MIPTRRILGLVVTLVWLAAMAALVRRDILPFWQTQNPPAQDLPPGHYQVGIFNDGGGRVGTSWTTASSTSGQTTVQSTTMIDLAAVASFLPTLRMLVLDSTLTFDQQHTLDDFRFALHGAGIPIQVSGERLGRDFACSARIGSLTRNLALDAQTTAHLSDSFRPFTHLRGLRVGQSWRLRLLDPMGLVQDQQLDFQIKLARVTAQEEIGHAGRRVLCHRIETPGAVAWADDSGRVLRQELNLPLLGKWVLNDEPFDAAARAAARAALTGRDSAGGGS